MPSVEERIRESLQLLVWKLENGEKADQERAKFQDDLSGAIHEAIDLAIERHLASQHES